MKRDEGMGKNVARVSDLFGKKQKKIDAELADITLSSNKPVMSHPED